MTHLIRPFLSAALLAAGASGLSAQATPPVQTTPPAETAPPPQGAPPATGVLVAPAQIPPVPATPAGPPATRTFTATCGLWFHPVRPERVVEFERFLDYVRAALAKTPNARLRAQAAGWRFFKAAEPGPNGVALYVFVIDPAIPGAEYALGPILSEAYPDPAQLTEIWALYTGSVTSGGTILNTVPVIAKPPQPLLTPAVNPTAPGQKPVAPAPAGTPVVPLGPLPC